MSQEERETDPISEGESGEKNINFRKKKRKVVISSLFCPMLYGLVSDFKTNSWCTPSFVWI